MLKNFVNRIRFNHFTNNRIRRAAKLIANGESINHIVHNFNVSDIELGKAIEWASWIEDVR